MERYLTYQGTVTAAGLLVGTWGLLHVLSGDPGVGAFLLLVGGFGMALTAVVQVWRSDPETRSVPEGRTYLVTLIGLAVVFTAATVRVLSLLF